MNELEEIVEYFKKEQVEAIAISFYTPMLITSMKKQL